MCKGNKNSLNYTLSCRTICDNSEYYSKELWNNKEKSYYISLTKR